MALDEAPHYRIGRHDWAVRVLEGRQIVHGQDLDYHVDQSDHTIDVSRGTDEAETMHWMLSAVEVAAGIEVEELVGVAADSGDGGGGNIEPLSYGGPGVPLLPDDPAGDN